MQASGVQQGSKATFEHYLTFLGRIAIVAFGKYPHCNKFVNAVQRIEALVVYMDMSEGRMKSGLKGDPWVTQQLEGQLKGTTKSAAKRPASPTKRAAK